MEKHGDKIDFDVLAEMDELHFCIKEALRMHPPLIMLLRQCHVPFEVETTEGKKFVVPKGHIVATSPAFAHRMDKVYTEPEKYKPERFKGDKPEDKNAYASFIGFGSGRHLARGLGGPRRGAEPSPRAGGGRHNRVGRRRAARAAGLSAAAAASARGHGG